MTTPAEEFESILLMLHPLFVTLRDGSDWPVAVQQVTDQIERMTADDARAGLLGALVALVAKETA